MKNLSELSLSLDLNENLSSSFCGAFQGSKAEFPSFQTLELTRAPNAAFILKACPRVRNLCGITPEDLMEEDLCPPPIDEDLVSVRDGHWR